MSAALHTILIVDDEEAVLRTLRRFLQRDGFRVETAGSARDALELLRAGLAPHVVICDYRMPGMDGVAFLKIVRSEYPRSQRILMTGHADISAIEEAVNVSKIYRFLAKPWDEPGLLATVRSAVEQWQLEDENRRLSELTQEQTQKLVETNRDLEEKVAARTQLLSRAKREWEVAFDTIDDPLMIVDRELRIVRANLALARHLGQDITALPRATCHEARAASIHAIRRDADGVCQGCPVRQAQRTGQPTEGELTTERERVFSLRAYPIADDERGAVVCTYRDLTEQRAMNKQLAQADKLSAMGLLAGGVAHEINNPLGAILAFAQLLRREPMEEEEEKEYLKEIEDSAIRCKRIVERLLSFARQAKHEERRELNLNDVVRETSFLVEKSYLNAKFKLVHELSPEVSAVNAISNELAQVLLNLITNARDAMPHGGTIKVSTRNSDDGATVELSVADTGSGIPPEVLARIFDPFFTTKPEGTGTGLGLSVSYGIVRDHKGKILVRSKPGEGTEFTVVLPRA